MLRWGRAASGGASEGVTAALPCGSAAFVRALTRAEGGFGRVHGAARGAMGAALSTDTPHGALQKDDPWVIKVPRCARAGSLMRAVQVDSDLTYHVKARALDSLDSTWSKTLGADETKLSDVPRSIVDVNVHNEATWRARMLQMKGLFVDELARVTDEKVRAEWVWMGDDGAGSGDCPVAGAGCGEAGWGDDAVGDGGGISDSAFFGGAACARVQVSGRR